jgi:phage terminase large subunit
LEALRIKASNVFDTINASKKRIVIARGGTRAGKTYAIMQLLALWLVTGIFRGKQSPAKLASVVRKTLPSLKATAMRDFEEILQAWLLFDKIEINKTDKIYSFGGRTVEFFSVDDQQKVRGRKRDILFCNEANELNFETDFFQLNIRTTECIILDLNPSDPYVWIKTEIEDKRAHDLNDVDSFVFTYKDNGFLSAEQCREIEAISDPVLREVYVRGNYGAIEGLIFPKITVVESFPMECKKVAIGLDFGYTNDPTAALLCGIIGDNLYVDELIYEYALTNDLIAKKLPKNVDVYADSAEPKSIEELRKFGVKSYSTTKGKDSIVFGINTLKRYNLHITAKSTNLLKEQKLYKYKTDNVGNPTNDPIDHYNHAWDAVRYYALSVLTKNERKPIHTSK